MEPVCGPCLCLTAPPSARLMRWALLGVCMRVCNCVFVHIGKRVVVGKRSGVCVCVCL